MRVFYVVSTRVVGGGANRSLINLIAALKKLYPDFSCSALINYEGSMSEALRELGVKCYIMPFPGAMKTGSFKVEAKKWLYNFYARARIAHFMREDKPDLVHNNSLPKTTGMEVARRLKIPYICHIRENIWDGLGGDFTFPSVVKRVVKDSACVIAISDYIRRSYEDFTDHMDVKVLYDGIRTEDYYIPDRKILSSEGVNLLMVGVINPQKGQMDAVQAVFELWKRGFENLHLTIVGLDGALEYPDRVRDFARENIDGMVSFPGEIIENEKLTQVRGEHDINLICSSAEGLGRTTIESMLSGALTVGADAGATPEIITNGETGLLYACRDPMDLADKIQWALEHREEARAIAARGQEFARQRYSIESYAESMMEIYKELAK